MGVNNAELYNNIGLCCFYAQQYDMTFNCFMRALAIATDDNLADVWYNIAHVALVSHTLCHSLSLSLTYSLPQSLSFPYLKPVGSLV